MKEQNFGRNKGEQHKKCANQAYDRKWNPRLFAAQTIFFEKQCFQDKNNRRCEKEDCHVKPIGRFSKRSIVGVEQNRNQHEPCYDSNQFYTPKAFVFPEKSALYQRENKQRKTHQLHMLPCGFIDSRKRRDQDAFIRKIIQKM